ncbi:transposase [Sphingosinicella humi]|uniref:transposase n=1 Tax=Allosphingosinicella humi TaxID=2068657 RepID=UPI001304EAD3|nr:transposase [Sphingosinicella humi]
MNASTAQRIGSYVDFLDLEQCRTRSVDESGVPIRVYAELLPPAQPECPSCGSVAAPHGMRTQNYVDRPISGKPVVICLDIKRARCRNSDCDVKTFQLNQNEEFNDTITRRCKSYIEDQCFSRTFASLAAETGVPESTIRRIADSLLSKINRNFRIDTPRIIAIDDVCLPSGKDRRLPAKLRTPYPERRSMAYRTVISDTETSQVVDLLEDRRLSTVLEFLLNLQGWRRVRYVTIDMSNTYRDAVWLAFGDAVTIIADRWHVTARVNAVVDGARRALKGIPQKARRSFRMALLARGRELQARNPDRHAELMEFLQSAPDLATVYIAKEELLDIYDARSAVSAKYAYHAWKSRLTVDVAAKFGGVIKMFNTWEKEIFAYWSVGFVAEHWDASMYSALTTNRSPTDPLIPMIRRLSRYRRWVGPSNGKAEARNQVIRLLNRLGRSYSFRFLRARAIFSTFRVADRFGICAECRIPFKRNPQDRRRSREQRFYSAYIRAPRIQDEVPRTPRCRFCDPSSTGVPRPGGKPYEKAATHCGLGDIWTEPEATILDDHQALQAVQTRYVQFKRSKRMKKDLRAEMEPLMEDLFACLV